MPLQLIQHPPDDVFVSLVRLVDDRCPYPNCTQPVSHLVMMRTSRNEGPRFENCLPLCASHSDAASRDQLDLQMLRTIRQLLRPARASSAQTGGQLLPTRHDYLSAVCDAVARGTKSLRCIYVGPLPFHPDWYFTLQESETGHPSMDRAIAACIGSGDCHTFIILRNHPRYAEKVKSFVPSRLLAPLIDETIENLRRAIGSENGNRIVAADTGAFHIPIILDNVYISALRAQPSSPIDSGLLSADPSQVAWERQAFDRLFEHYESQSTQHLDTVVRYLQDILE